MKRSKIVFLLHNAYAIGGTVRATLDLAAALADRHDVEIVSAARHLDAPRHPLDPRVTLVPLVDTRPGSADLSDPAYTQPAADFPVTDRRHHQYTRLTDLRVRAHLARSDADVVIGTRPGLNVYVALFAPRRALRIGKEELRDDAHGIRIRGARARHYQALDAVVTTYEADPDVPRARTTLPGVRVVSVPHPASPPQPSNVPSVPNASRVIVAAGRPAPGTCFDLLLEAFSAVAAKAPDWRLDLYGVGSEGAEADETEAERAGDAAAGDEGRLRALISGLGLSAHVRLLGTRMPVEAELAKASLVVCAADPDPTGTAPLLTAMRCAVPVITTDRSPGSAGILTDGVDGRLVPAGDARALVEAMFDLVADEPLRHALGRAALDTARRHDAPPLAARYEKLFAELRATRHRRSWTRERARALSWARRATGPVARPGAPSERPAT